VIAGGAATVLLTLGCAAALVAPAWLLARRERGWAVIAGAQLGGQELVHAAHTLAAGTVEVDVASHDLMFYGHILTAVLLAVWLRSGERRSWAAVRHATHGFLERWRALLVLFTRPAVLTAPWIVGPSPELSSRSGWFLRHSVIRRGPPLVA
jgi:hypothetical protein